MLVSLYTSAISTKYRHLLSSHGCLHRLLESKMHKCATSLKNVVRIMLRYGTGTLAEFDSVNKELKECRRAWEGTLKY